MEEHLLAAQVLDGVWSGHAGPKELCLGARGPLQEHDHLKPRVYALVCQTLKYHEAIVDILKIARFKPNATLFRSLLHVLVYDLLFGNGLPSSKARQRHSKGAAALKTIMNSRQKFSNALLALKESRKVVEDEDLIPERMRPAPVPRYARVNTLRTDVDTVVRHLCDEMHFTQLPDPKPGDLYRDCILEPATTAGHSSTASSSSTKARERVFCRDRDLEAVLVFHPRAPLAQCPLVLSGDLILQDKSSCLPPVLLLGDVQGGLRAGVLMQQSGREKVKLSRQQRKRLKMREKRRLARIGGSKREASEDGGGGEEGIACPPLKREKLASGESLATTTATATAPLSSDAVVVDACAAPGNKTTYLASLLENATPVVAFDRDPKRMKLLQETLERCGATCVETRLQSFLDADPQSDALLKRATHILCDPSCSGSGMAQRLEWESEAPESLSQRLKSLSEFQEQVCCHALSFPSVQRMTYSTCSVHSEENEEVVLRVLKACPKFEVVPLLPSWPHRGLSSFSCGPHCLRASPETTETSGFFVACFQRKTKGQ